MSERAYG